MAELADEADAYLLFERLRWGGAPASCPHCGTAGQCRYLSPSGGRPRRTRTGSRTHRRVWRCGHCRRQFSVLTGTVFEGTRVPLQVWAGVVSDLVDRPADGRVVSADAVVRRHGVSPETARTILHRLRAAGLG